MSFAAPLGVGLTSNGEYVDIEVNSTESSQEMVSRINAANVEEMCIRDSIKLLDGPMTDERIRLLEDVSEQIRALQKMADMAARYGCDITKPAENAREAVQNLYMAYLAGIKENNGAATSLGRTATFLAVSYTHLTEISDNSFNRLTLLTTVRTLTPILLAMV